MATAVILGQVETTETGNNKRTLHQCIELVSQLHIPRPCFVASTVFLSSMAIGPICFSFFPDSGHKKARSYYG
jgi:hypothetical protein